MTITEKQQHAIQCADAWLKTEGLSTYTEIRDQLANIKANAVLIPDPRMNGATDCYAVPLDDIEAI